MILSVGFSMTAYAYAPDDADEPTTATSTPAPTSAPTPAPATSTPAPVPSSEPSTAALTPAGDLTLVDDIQTGDKQIMTVVTKSGNYFYIVIDRSADKENVYFLNLVDESDLMAIINGKSNANDTTSAATSVTSPAASSTEISQPTEPVPATTAPESKGGVNTGSIIIVVLLIAGAGGGAFYYFKVRKPKQGAAKGGNLPELEEYDFEEEDDGIIRDEEPGENQTPDNTNTENEQEDEDE
jgi:hypothetical protein